MEAYAFFTIIVERLRTAMRKGALNIAVKAARAAGARHPAPPQPRSKPRRWSRRTGWTSPAKSTHGREEIIRELKRAFPDYAILAEESGAIGGKSRFTWVIDPLDGTSNYLRGFPHFCVSIALVENGEPIHGVIFDPLRNELFTASRGSGAILNDKQHPRRRAQGPGRRDADHRLPAARAPHLDAHLAMTRALLLSEAEDIRRTGSAALDLAYVACGRADALLRSRREALGHRRRRAAGARSRAARCVDFRGGEDDSWTTGNIVAGNLKISDALVKAIVPHLTRDAATDSSAVGPCAERS